MLKYLNRKYFVMLLSVYFCFKRERRQESCCEEEVHTAWVNYEYDKLENSHFSYSTLVILTNMRNVL